MASNPPLHPILAHQKIGIAWRMEQTNGKDKAAENDGLLLPTDSM